jgi:hypothetical protein
MLPDPLGSTAVPPFAEQYRLALPRIASVQLRTDAGRFAELHICRRGAHGFGMVKQGFLSDRWTEQFYDWLTDLEFA